MAGVDIRDKVGHWLAREPATLILQPTSLCPLACTYCYLPERHLRQEMSPAIARAVASGIPSHWVSSGALEVVWHGGEPLAIGRSKMAALLEPFEGLRREGRVQHKVQTGATLITDEWCDLIERYGMAVGVSIDGPTSTNRRRVDRGGRPMFDRIVAGIETLRKRGLPFSVLAVVGQEATTQADEILTFLAALGCSWVGLNIEAKEAANRHGDTPTMASVRRFWRDTFTWSRNNPGMQVREAEKLLGYLGLDPDIRAADARHDLIPTVGWNGDVVLLSPELLGVHDPNYSDFVAGNVLVDPLPAILDRAADLAYVREFLVGLERCKATCEFFAYCQGAHAGNRYFEHGTFAATETDHCRASMQAPVLALADLMDGTEAGS